MVANGSVSFPRKRMQNYLLLISANASAMFWPPASLLGAHAVRSLLPFCRLLPPCVLPEPSTLSRKRLYRLPICDDRFSLVAALLARTAAEMLPGGADLTLAAGGAPCTTDGGGGGASGTARPASSVDVTS